MHRGSIEGRATQSHPTQNIELTRRVELDFLEHSHRVNRGKDCRSILREASRNSLG